MHGIKSFRDWLKVTFNDGRMVGAAKADGRFAVAFEHNHIHIRRPCLVCGQYEKPCHAEVSLFEDGERQGSFCERHLKDGLPGLRRELIALAEQCEAEAAWLRQVAAADMNLPSYQEWEAAEEQFEREDFPEAAPAEV